MQIFSKSVPLSPACPPEILAGCEAPLFLDIETTGLSPGRAQIYMIAALFEEEGRGWTLRQWFADTLSSEAEMIRDFFELLPRFRTLIHYNGDSFDLPFLARCAAQYGMRAPFSSAKSLDLYRVARRFRRLFPTERINQRSMERFFGAGRQDRFSGAELIAVYESWLKSREDGLLRLLLLHNEEDVRNLPALLSLLSYRAFFQGDFSGFRAEEAEGGFFIRCRGCVPLPKAVSLSFPPFQLTAEGSSLSLRAPVLRETMFHYFKNYQDYFYLPLEDQAVHKSVAAFVDRGARVRASARTARVKRSSAFLALPGRGDAAEAPFPRTPCFRKSYEAPERCAELRPELLEDPLFQSAYLAAALRQSGLLED